MHCPGIHLRQGGYTCGRGNTLATRRGCAGDEGFGPTARPRGATAPTRPAPGSIHAGPTGAGLSHQQVQPQQHGKERHVPKGELNQVSSLGMRQHKRKLLVRDEARHGGDERTQAAQVSAHNEAGQSDVKPESRMAAGTLEST